MGAASCVRTWKPSCVTSAKPNLMNNRSLSPQARLLLGLFALAAGLHALGVGAGPASTELDPSWTAVLGWASATGQQFGRDIVLTFGPLGFLHPNASYVAPIYPTYLIGQLLLAAAFGVSCYALLARMSLRQRLLYCVTGFACAPWIAIDALWLLVLSQNCVALCLPLLGARSDDASRQAEAPSTAWILPLFLGVTAAAIALLKFSMLPVALTTVASASLALALEQRRFEAVSHLFGFLAGVLALWMGTGQALAHLPAFVSGSVEVVATFASAMGVMPHPLVDFVGFTSMALSGGWLGWQAWAQRRRAARALPLFALGCAVYVAWRQGFTRADAHIHQALPLLTLAPLLGIALHRELGRRALIAGIAASVLALAVGLALARDQLSVDRWARVLDRMPQVVSAYARPSELISQREAIAEQLRSSHALTRIRERVGSAGVDILNWEQGLLVLHGMHYQPRPVYQSYQAHSVRLMRMNEAHFLDANAPRYVLLKLQAIDGRLPSGEDALALVALLRAYVPVLEESGFLLFERSTDGSVDALPELALDQSVEFGEWFELPDSKGPKLLALDAEPSALGRLYAFWFRTPPLMLEVETAGGLRSSYRLQPKATRAGFLLSPLLRSTQQLSGLYTGRPPESVRRARIYSALPAYQAMWGGRVRIGFGSFTWRRPTAEQSEALLPDTAHAGFRLRDIARDGLIQRIEEGGREVLFMHAPAHLDFMLPAGRFEVMAEFGIREAAIGDSGCIDARADGIRLALYLRRADQAKWQPQAAIDIDPWRNPQHRGPQELRVRIDSPADAQLRVAMEQGPSGAQTACDWGWVHGLLIRSQPEPH